MYTLRENMISKSISLSFRWIAGQLIMVLPSLREIRAFVACDTDGQQKGRAQDICIVQMDGWEWHLETASMA